jgi:hypothetical protein
LSRLIIKSTFDITLINDYFPNKYLFSISATPWFVNIINFLATRDLVAHWSTQDKTKFFSEGRTFIGMTLNYSSIVLIKYFEDAFLTMVNSIIKLSFWGMYRSFLVKKKKQLQKSYNVDFIGPPCSKMHMHFSKLVKLSKVRIHFKSWHDVFKSYSYRWNVEIFNC